MTWDQVRDLRQRSFDIGCHTNTHADFGTIDGSAIREELAISRGILEREMHAPTDLFSYPFGGKQNITEEARSMVRAAGFRCCLSCHGGVNRVADDPYYLTRIPVSSWYLSPHHLGAHMLAGRT
jgi:peptidoglycan/xylan/chitin deacetylase (PgdA/CDA1 family)